MITKTNLNENTYISLFCGGGGGSLGLKESGWTNIYGLDLNKKQCELYKRNIGTCLNRDILSVDFNELKKEYGTPKLLMISTKCQEFSKANPKNNKIVNRPIDNITIQLFDKIEEAIQIYNSEYVLFENVPNIQNFDIYYDFINKVKSLGYFVNEKILKSSDFGGLTKRKRVFILFSKKEIKNLDEKLEEFKKTNEIEYIEDKKGNIEFKNVDNNVLNKDQNIKYIDIYERIKIFINIMKKYNKYGRPTKEISKEIKENKGPSFQSEFHIIGKDCKQINTILTKPHFLISSQTGYRFLSIEELKYIQGYPKNYDFGNLSFNQCCYSIGESITPIITKVFGNILKK